jgi:hypothetical protein
MKQKANSTVNVINHHSKIGILKQKFETLFAVCATTQ